MVPLLLNEVFWEKAVFSGPYCTGIGDDQGMQHEYLSAYMRYQDGDFGHRRLQVSSAAHGGDYRELCWFRGSSADDCQLYSVVQACCSTIGVYTE